MIINILSVDFITDAIDLEVNREKKNTDTSEVFSKTSVLNCGLRSPLSLTPDVSIFPSPATPASVTVTSTPPASASERTGI